MRTSAPGNKRAGRLTRPPRPRGFTLIELLVVVAIIAIASAGVALALRDDGGARLDREAQRLSALFESARAQSRTTGIPVVWHPLQGGFRFEGVPAGSLPERWLYEDTVVRDAARIVLGPEPMIPRQSVQLGSAGAPDRTLRIATDGVRPFVVQDSGTP